MMAGVNTEPKAGAEEESGSPSEPNEHDYASAAAGVFSPEVSAGPPGAGGRVPALQSFISPFDPGQSVPEQPLSVEIPGPAVGAEVDCPGGNAADSAPLLTRAGGDSGQTPGCGAAGPVRGGRRGSVRPEDRNCSCCRLEFERTGRSFNRRAVHTFTTPDTVLWVFPDSPVNERSFLCETCAQTVRSKCRRRQSGKRSVWLKPPAVRESEVKDQKKGRRMGKKSKAALLVSKSCYKAALKMLWSAKGARKPMMEFWSKQLKEEMKALTRQPNSPFHQKVTSRKPLSSFPWHRCLNWAQEKAPLVITCLTSLFPDIGTLSKSSHQLSEEQAQALLERRAVVALSVPLFTRNIWKNNFLQAALGAELRLQGCSSSALEALNTMGLCQNKDTVRLLLQRLRNRKKTNGQRLKIQQDPMKGEQAAEEEDEEDETETEEEELQDTAQEEEEDEAAEEEAVIEKRRRKKVKKQRKSEKRKQRGKRKLKEREEEEEEVGQKKRQVVVVRLDLLKGQSQVEQSELSAP
ncbi:uncharacterized protein [Antennarius striatus]|uniref:uncharacterized protein n=1 Tax=Antennarius striatus TaxID=241820 RepID=UPI0035B2A046